MSNTIDTSAVASTIQENIKQAAVLSALKSNAQHESSLHQASNPIETDVKPKEKLTALVLPAPAAPTTATGSDPRALLSEQDGAPLFNMLTMIALILANSANTSEELGISQGSLANQQEQFTVQSADSTYNADMNKANGAMWSAILGIVFSVVAIGLAAAGPVMEGISASAEAAEGTLANVPLIEKGGRAAVNTAEDASGGAEGAVEGAEEEEAGAGESASTRPSSSTIPNDGINSNVENNINEQTGELENGQANNTKKIEDAQKGGAADTTTSTQTPQSGGPNAGNKVGKSNVFKNCTKFVQILPVIVQGLGRSIGDGINSSYQSKAAPETRTATDDQATSSLASAAFQETSSSVNSTDKLNEQLNQVAQQTKQYLANIASSLKN